MAAREIADSARRNEDWERRAVGRSGRADRVRGMVTSEGLALVVCWGEEGGYSLANRRATDYLWLVSKSDAAHSGDAPRLTREEIELIEATR